MNDPSHQTFMLNPVKVESRREVQTGVILESYKTPGYHLEKKIHEAYLLVLPDFGVNAL